MTAILIRLAVLVTVFALIFLVSQRVLLGMANRRAETKAINRRMELLKAGITHEQANEILRKGVADQLAPDAGLIERLYYRFQKMVRVADIPADPRTILAASLLAFIGLTSLFLFLAWLAKFTITVGIIQLVLVVVASLTIVLPLMLISRRKEKRRKLMEEQFPVALDVFTRALLAGHPIASAIDLLTHEMEDPLGSEFGLVADEVSYGSTLTESLMAMADRWDQPDIRMFAVSISLQSETGGNLAEILRNLSMVIRERATLYMKVRALSSEGRMTGWMLSVLPVITIVSLFVLNSSFYFEVASDPIFVQGFTGLLMLYALGVLWIRKLIDLKV